MGQGGGGSPSVVTLVYSEGHWHAQHCLDAGLKIKLLIKTSEVSEVELEERSCRTVMCPETGVALCIAGQDTKEVLVTGKQGCHREQENPHIFTSSPPPPEHYIGITGLSISLTGQWRQVPEGVTLPTLECALHTHTHITEASRCPLTHIWRWGTWAVSTAWGVVAGRTSRGPFT